MHKKYFYLLFMVCLVTQIADAQSRKFDQNFRKSSISQYTSGNTTRSAVPTEVFWPSFGDSCAATFTSFNFIDPALWGSVSGTNVFGDLEKAQLLEFTGSDEYFVTLAVAFFTEAKSVGSGKISMHVYDVDEGTGGPGQRIGSTNSISVDSLALPDTIANSALPTPFSFADSPMMPALSTSKFFVSVDLSDTYPNGDTVTIFQTNDDCGDGGNTWDLIPGNTWVAFNDSASWLLNSDLVLAAVVDFNESTSADDFIANKGLRIFPAYPNPARERVQLNYAIDVSGKISLEIFDTQGKKVHNMKTDVLSSGRHEEVVKTVEWPIGTYYYRISSDQGNIMSRFVVQR